MRPQLLITAVGIFILGTMLCCICTGTWLVNGEPNIINGIASFSGIHIMAGGGWSVLKATDNFTGAMATALSWDYPFLRNQWCIFVKFPLWLVSIAVVWAMLEVMLNVLQGIVSAIGNIISSFIPHV